MGRFYELPLHGFVATIVPLWKISSTMIKMLFWGVIGYVIYRYFQMKEQLKEGRYRDFVQRQQKEKMQHPRKEAASEKRRNDGEFIDYEEIK